MSRARSYSFAVFFPTILLAFTAFFLLPGGWKYVAFLGIGIVGLGLSQRIFDATATPEEKRVDLEERANNPP